MIIAELLESKVKLLVSAVDRGEGTHVEALRTSACGARRMEEQDFYRNFLAKVTYFLGVFL